MVLGAARLNGFRTPFETSLDAVSVLIGAGCLSLRGIQRNGQAKRKQSIRSAHPFPYFNRAVTVIFDLNESARFRGGRPVEYNVGVYEPFSE